MRFHVRNKSATQPFSRRHKDTTFEIGALQLVPSQKPLVTTVLVCEQEPYPIWFSRGRKDIHCRVNIASVVVNYLYDITKLNRALWLVSQPLPFSRGCTLRNWASAVKFRQIQQISSPDGKIHRWKVEVEENTKLPFWRKKTKDQATNFPWMNESLFSSRLESAEGKSSERRFKVHFVCFL